MSGHEYVPEPALVNAFKVAWHEADDDGQAGKRVEIALAKVMGPALRAAKAQAWDEGWEACHKFMGRGIFPPVTNPYRQGADDE